MSTILSSFLLLLFTYVPAPALHFRVPASTRSIAISNRRTLHEPFFPSPSSSSPAPPSLPPAPPSLPPAHPPVPSLPKYPSSSTTATTPTVRPFFPFYPSPPPPPSSSSSAASYPSNPATSLPTFPANISSVVASPVRRHASPGSKLVTAISLPLLAAAALASSLLLFLLHRRSNRRRRGGDKDARSDSLRFFPPDTTASDGRKLSPTTAASSASGAAPAGAEFLYLGTLVSSRGGGGGGRANDDSTSSNAGGATGDGSPYRKLGSPELHPLPPLPRQCREAEECRSSPEEYYSPKDSPPAKGSAGVAAPSDPKKAASGVEMERWGSRSSTLSTPSYGLSSNVASSPSRSSPAASSPPPLPPLKPPPLLRPPTPPPKRRPPSHSPSSSPPPEVECEKKIATLQASGKNLWSPRKIGDFAKNQTVAGRKPPPPPPPPLRAAYKEGQNAKTPPLLQPPVLVPPKPVETRSFSTTAALPAESPKTSDVPADCSGNSRPKLKPLHWDKVRASSDREMVWDQLKSSSFQLNEEMIETLFVSNVTNKASNSAIGCKVNTSTNQESRVLDPKKSQNIAILLRALNVTKEEVCGALVEGRAESLGNELLEALMKMIPNKEEELRLKEYKDDSPFKLGPAESFLKAVLDIPFAFKRVDAMLYIVNFDPEVKHLRNLFATLEAACEELRCNRMFRKLLGAVLKTGNRMNLGTNRGDAQAFKLDTLLKLVDIKGTDGKTTLLHFVVQEITRVEGTRISSANAATLSTQQSTLADLDSRKHGLQLVSGLGDELPNVKKAAAMDSDMLSSYVLKLSGGIGKVQEVVRLNDAILNEHGRQFHDSMLKFLTKAEHEILEIQDEESMALSLVKEITEYFHGDSAKEEAHPFRIFTVVRDFLAILDQVCKDVEKNIESTISSVRQFQLTANQASLSAFPRFHAARSSDEESS